MKAHLHPTFPPAFTVVGLVLISTLIFLPILCLAAILAGIPYGIGP